ncbi:MAG TPA: hypothetical protein DCR40_15180 [Prolixibacteraceae bacterium]|nr:hypothetical protein [Prolixibacteraceae bacterium]
MKPLYMNENDTIKRKINSYFNGQLPADDEAEIVNWMKLDEKNRLYFFQIKSSLDPQKMEHPLLESSFSELQSKLTINQQFNSKLTLGVKRIYFPLLHIAAMLLIAAIAGFSIAYLTIQNNAPKTELAWFETKVSRGEKSQLILPDGSKVWVNSESSISYPSNFMEGNREIKLNGEAYFEVAKFEGEPFTVKTNDYNVRVLGTKFNIMAYSDFNRTETSLIEGKIEIQKGGQHIPVVPGQTLTFSDNKFSIIKTNASQKAQWKDGIFDFDQITFKELVVRLEHWYDVDIIVRNPELNRIVYSGIFKNEETIWQVLNTFQMTLPIRYSRSDFRTFVIVKK